MRIELTIEGGLAHFPGLSRPTVIDSDTLSAEEAGKLAELVAAARFFERPTSAGPPRRGAADYRQYTITVEDEGRRHSIHLVDPVGEPPLQELLRFLQTTARAQRRREQSSPGQV